MIVVDKTCRLCKTNHQLKVKENDLYRIETGEHIQDVMPYLSADERELFISGICGKCFDEIFSDSEDEE